MFSSSEVKVGVYVPTTLKPLAFEGLESGVLSGPPDGPFKAKPVDGPPLASGLVVGSNVEVGRLTCVGGTSCVSVAVETPFQLPQTNHNQATIISGVGPPNIGSSLLVESSKFATLNLGTQRNRGRIRRVGSSKSVPLMRTKHLRFAGCRRRKPRKTSSDEEVVGKLRCSTPNMQGSSTDACSQHLGEDGIAVVGDTGGHNVVGGLIKCNEARMGCAAAEDGALTTGSEVILFAAREEAY